MENMENMEKKKNLLFCFLCILGIILSISIVVVFFFGITYEKPIYTVKYYINSTDEVSYTKSYTKKFKFETEKYDDEEYVSSEFKTCWFTLLREDFYHPYRLNSLSEDTLYEQSFNAYIFYGDTKEMFTYMTQINSLNSSINMNVWSKEYKDNDLEFIVTEYDKPSFIKDNDGGIIKLRFIYTSEGCDYCDVSIEISHLESEINILKFKFFSNDPSTFFYGIYNNEVLIVENEYNFNDVRVIKCLLNDYLKNIPNNITSNWWIKDYLV